MIEEVLEKGYEYLDKKGFGNMFEETTKSTWEMFEDACDNPLRDPDKLRGESVFIDTKVLYIDEVQDLTPLQWEWYLLQKLVVEKVYLAGDSDQTIYGWGGADPSLFINEEGETEILDRTYRVPSNIWEVCDGVIRQCDERVEKEVQPDGDGGEFVQLDCPTENEIGNLVQSGEWMVLFRANYMVDEFAKILMNEGVPYRNMSTFDNWTEDFEYLRDAMSALYHKQDRMDGDAFRAMLEYANGNMVKNEDLVSKTEEIMGKFNGIPMEKVRDTFRVVDGGTKKPLRAEPFLEASTEINYYEKEAIMGNIENKNEHLDPNKIRLGTIHSSKGKEAPNVLVGTDSTKTVLKEMRSRLRDEGSVVDVDMENRDMGMTDAERRVYYVGMTRASERLVLGHNVLDSEACIPPETLLADDHTEDKDDYEKWKQAGPQ
jgi:DNA helicase-2/ATP-dependent DNA helicase PcrA